jgi:hypothetical protein
LLLSPLDRGVARTAKAYLRAIVGAPTQMFTPLRMQSIMIIQPADFLEDGAVSMCDGCPDMTVRDGKLVWSCRLEEPRAYGEFVRAVPKPKKNGVNAVAE